MNSKYTVVVVGAGPVGLLTALKLGQKGVSTLVLEKHSEILDASRAIAYGSPGRNKYTHCVAGPLTILLGL